MLVFSLHLLALVVTLFFIYPFYKQDQDLRLPFLLFLSIFGAGPFGLAAFLLMALFYPLFIKTAINPSIWLDELFLGEDPSKMITTFERIKVGWDDYKGAKEVSSFQDIFTYGSILQKQAVLDMIAKKYQPSYGSILKKALANPSNVIRLQTAAIIEKINEEFEAKLNTLLMKISENPEDHTLLLKLAVLHNEHAESEILDSFRQGEMQAKAIDYYSQYLKFDPSNKAIQLALGRLLFQKKEYVLFIKWRDTYLKQFKALPSIVEEWAREAQYRLSLS